jgi:hypothetical protein
VVWPRPGVPHDAPGIAGQRVDFPISLGVYMKDDGKPVPAREETSAAVLPGTLDRIDEAPFLEAFGDLTGVRTYGGMDVPRTSAAQQNIEYVEAAVTLQYDLRPWTPLLTKLIEGEHEDRAWRVRAAFQAVSPERVNLALNQVTDFRTELVSLLLGGSTSQWTNVQLAEALSRLVTGRQIEANMVQSVRPREAAPDATALPQRPQVRMLSASTLSDEARDTVLRGMQRVVLGSHGTARAMAARIRELEARHPGFRIALFSKTGSPTVQRPESKPAGAILRQMVQRGLLSYDGRGLAVTSDRGVQPTPYAARGTKGRDAFLAALSRASRAAARHAGVTAGPRTIARIASYADRFHRYRDGLTFDSPATVRLTESASSPIHVVAGALVLNSDHAIFDPSQQNDSSAAYVLSLVKWRGAGDVPTREELSAPESRVVTAVFYYDVGPGSAVAVDAARAMMGELGKLME